MHTRQQLGLAVLGLLLVTWEPAQLSGSPTIHAVPFEFVRNQVLVDVHVEGQGPFRMHMDTAVYPSVSSFLI